MKNKIKSLLNVFLILCFVSNNVNAQNTFNLTTLVSPTGAGLVIGGGTYPAKQVVSVLAQPVAGSDYRFVGWAGDVNSSDNPVSITMNNNLTIIAVFKLGPPSPTKLTSGTGNNFLLKTDGTLWAWGANRFGDLGFGDDSNSSIYSPNQLLSDVKWKDISVGGYFFSIAIKANGRLWAWGNNEYGQLGDGTTITKYSPVCIGLDNNWANVSSGFNHCLAIKTDGSLWSWGNNDVGQLGDGTHNSSYSPIQIGTEKNWKYISSGYSSSMAIKNDGTLWKWGAIGNNDWRMSPTQVGTDNDWKEVCISFFYALAIKQNGTLWAWGKNDHGQLGDGTTIATYTPIQIQTDNDWKHVAASCIGETSLALKTNGTIWGWGENLYGEIGDGTRTERHIPTQALDISGKSLISSGNGFSISIDNDNNLCGSGSNDDGELGDGTSIGKTTFNCVNLSTNLKSAKAYNEQIEKLALSGTSKSYLLQNYPNPVQGSTNIDYYLADNTGTPKIVIYNFTGEIVKEYPINSLGKSSININIESLSSGIYSYALVLNGSKVDVKKLLIIK